MVLPAALKMRCALPQTTPALLAHKGRLLVWIPAALVRDKFVLMGFVAL